MGGPVSVLTLGKAAGLAAAALLMLQFTLSARLKVLDRAVGVDRLMRVHRLLGPTAVCLALLHPLLVYASETHSAEALSWRQWPQMLGAFTLLLLTASLSTTWGKSFLQLRYESWRWIHRVAFAAVAIIVVHAAMLGSDLQAAWSRSLWLGAAFAYGALFLWAKVAKPCRLRQRPFHVRAVTRLCHNVWEVRVRPQNPPLFAYQPGQFAFLGLHRAEGPNEQHPFTISSSPTSRDELIFTIKASGDFTSTIGRTRPNDGATVDGPYGRFSYLSWPDADSLILIAGGVGITPILSGLRHIRDTGGDKPITLIWANRTRRDIFLRAELDEIRQAVSGLVVHHLLSDEPDYDGPRGYLNRALLARLLPDVPPHAHVMLCGPPPMMDAVSKALRQLGMRPGRIHTERFAL